MNQWNKRYLLPVFICSLLLLCSCSQEQRDREIKADFTVKAKGDIDYAGIRFTVKDGIISIDGECPTQVAKSKVETKAKALYAVKEIISHIKIAPVVIGTDHQLKQGVDSILGKYPGVEAIVKDSVVHLLGKAENKDEQKLLAAIQTLRPRQLQNEVAFK